MRMPKRPPEFSSLISQVAQEGWHNILGKVRGPTYQGKYLHWDELLRRASPEGLSYEQWWVGLKLNRDSQRKVVPLRDVRGHASSFTLPEVAQKLLHEITQRASGSMGASDKVANPETRDRYLIRNLMEEGITSSLIEGAATTRDQAKQMLKTQRKPKNLGEQMVLNNYRAMQEIIDLG
ncbi:MAG: Fic family protein, partial [Phycisphaerae bacterium]